MHAQTFTHHSKRRKSLLNLHHDQMDKLTRNDKKCMNLFQWLITVIVFIKIVWPIALKKTLMPCKSWCTVIFITSSTFKEFIKLIFEWRSLRSYHYSSKRSNFHSLLDWHNILPSFLHKMLVPQDHVVYLGPLIRLQKQLITSFLVKYIWENWNQES